MVDEDMVSTRIPKSLKQKLEKLAQENNTSIQKLITQLLSEALSAVVQPPAQEGNEFPDS